MDETIGGLRSDLGGRYEVEQEIGRGGMAVVYLANDIRHGRRVALKVLRSDIGVAEASDRFLREIRTAAQLHHPHILPLYDSGTAGDRLFYVMPYVEGETLRERLEKEGALPVEEAVRIAREVADALQFAHDRGVIHRDIKPENIMLSAGHAAVADFGIARAADAAGIRLTDAGMAVGTPAYMSPEQATADPNVDGRADQYALGCVLYEMLTGAPPFTGATARAVMARHTTDPVPPLTTVRAVPVALETVVRKALAKVPADRWPSARDFSESLDRAMTARISGEATAAPGRRRRTSTQIAVGAAALGAIALIAVASVWYLNNRRMRGERAGLADETSSVAVLPLTFTGDPRDSIIAEGVREQLIQGLARVGGIRMPVSGRVDAYRGKAFDPRIIGRELGVSTVLYGRVHVANGRLRMMPELVRVSDGTVIWTDKLDGVLAEGDSILDLFDIQDEMARKVVTALLPRLAPAKRAVAARGTRTKSQMALRLYLEAVRAPNSMAGNRTAVGLLEQALRIDSTFSDAWVQLAQRLTLGGRAGVRPAEAAVRWRRAIEKAIEYDSTNADAYAARGYYRYAYDWDWDGALSDLRRAIALNPALRDQAVYIALVFSFTNRTDSGLVYARRAAAIDPSSPWPWNILGKVYAFAHMPDSAIAASERSLSIDSTMWHTNWVLMNAYRDRGRVADAEAARARLIRQSGRAPDAISLVAAYYARAGNRGAARRLRDQLEQRARNEYVPWSARAVARFAAGDTVGALDALQASLDDRDVSELPGMLSLHFATLADNPRFRTIKRRVFGDRPMLAGPYPF